MDPNIGRWLLLLCGRDPISVMRNEWVKTISIINSLSINLMATDPSEMQSDDQQAVISPDGLQRWFRNNVLHRDGDQPAVIYRDGTQYWYQNGELHRDGNQPAIIFCDGTQKWYRFGVPARDNDQPTAIYPNGTQEWSDGRYRGYDQLHRDGDQPAVIRKNGHRMWYQHDQIHRDNGRPAVIDADGCRLWYEHGRFLNGTKMSDTNLYKVFLMVDQSEQLSEWLKFKDLCLDQEEISTVLTGTDDGYELEQIRNRWNRVVAGMNSARIAQLQAERDKLNAELDKLGQSLQTMNLSVSAKRSGSGSDVDPDTDPGVNPKRIRV
jgi:hypothetical protein